MANQLGPVLCSYVVKGTVEVGSSALLLQNTNSNALEFLSFINIMEGDLSRLPHQTAVLVQPVLCGWGRAVFNRKKLMPNCTWGRCAMVLSFRQMWKKLASGVWCICSSAHVLHHLASRDLSVLVLHEHNMPVHFLPSVLPILCHSVKSELTELAAPEWLYLLNQESSFLANQRPDSSSCLLQSSRQQVGVWSMELK